MANTKLTEKEEMVIRAIIAESNFNCNKLDITKSWEEQRLEGEMFWAFADVKDYGCGMGKQETRGVFGSLVKKGCMDVCDDDSCTWITIDEKQFNRIREYLA